MGLVDIVFPRSLARRGVLLALAALVVLATVLTFEAFDIRPCELCLAERYAWYAAVPVAAIAALVASRAYPTPARILFALIALAFLLNAGLAFYHVGVEEHWWQGPTACSGALGGPIDAGNLMNSLKTVKVVSCSEVQMRILGLSFAGWDVVGSLAMAAYAALAARARR